MTIKYEYDKLFDMNNMVIKLIIKNQADIWLKQNPLLLNSEEKKKFLIGLQDYLENENTILDDEVFDFLVQKKFIDNEPRETSFINYLTHKYENLKNYRVLDVGAGRICSLSKSIAQIGSNLTAIDTNIRLNNETLRKAKITPIKKLFKCDEFSKNGIGTNIQSYDLIVGLEPCDATEHIIRQSLKYNKPFDVNLCAAPHKGLNGETFKTYKEWYKHLSNISQEVSIIENECGFIATNN